MALFLILFDSIIKKKQNCKLMQEKKVLIKSLN